jgi:hypothetical protein
MPVETFQIESKRQKRAKRVQTAQHLAAAALLIVAAVPQLRHPVHGLVLPILELLTATALIVVTALEKSGRLHGLRLGWVEIAGAAMMFVEAFAKLQQKHHLSFYILSFVPPMIVLTFGIFDAAIRRTLGLKADEDRLELRLRLIWPRRARWEDVRAFRMSAKAVELDRHDGSILRLRLDDVINLEPAKDWIREQFVRRGIEELL